MTNEESNVANRIGKLVSDLTLDIEQVGIYIGRQPNVILNRLEIITETAREEKDDLPIAIDNQWRQVYNRTMNETTIENKCSILAELWMDYRDDVNFQDFISYADLGLPLAYAVDNDIIKLSPQAEKFVVEAFDLLVSSMGLEDTGFETLDDIFMEGDTEAFEDPNE